MKYISLQSSSLLYPLLSFSTLFYPPLPSSYPPLPSSILLYTLLSPSTLLLPSSTLFYPSLHSSILLYPPPTLLFPPPTLLYTLLSFSTLLYPHPTLLLPSSYPPLHSSLLLSKLSVSISKLLIKPDGSMSLYILEFGMFKFLPGIDSLPVLQ